MGESTVKKLRKCKCCEMTYWTNAQELREHSNICERVKKIGLIVGSQVVRPDYTIVKIGD